MIQKVFVRSAYNYDRDAVSQETGLDCERALDPETGELVDTPSLAKQSFAEECDINTIVRKFGLTGQMPVGLRMPTFGDFLDIPDYHSAMNAIREADESFYALPAELRARFGNDPGAFVEFCSDESNRPEAEKLGLVAPRVVEEPVGVPAVAGTPSGLKPAPEPVKELPIKP